MTSAEFKKGFSTCLQKLGFSRYGNVIRRDGAACTLVIGFQKEFGNQWFLNIGFFLAAIGYEDPSRVEKAHMYFRLERLFPALRETILTAGALADPEQPKAYQALQSLIDSDIDPGLRELSTESGLRAAYRSGRFQAGLITRPARMYLESTIQ